MEGETLLSKSAFAERQGWSPSYVTKLAKQGRLITSDDGRLVDVEKTLALLKRTSDPAKESVRQHHQAARTERHVGSHTKPTAPAGEDSGGSGAADPAYWSAKARRESALADLAEHELAVKRGEYVERRRVESAAFAAGRMLRDAALGLPTQIAPELANLTDPFEIEMKLRNALRRVFEDAARMTADDLDKAIKEPH